MSRVIQVHSIQATCFVLTLILASSFCLRNIVSTKDPSCTNPCSCCLATSPCTPSNDNCGDRCIDGIFGGKCKSSCPTNCLRCTGHPNVTFDSTYLGKGYCTECKDGYYSTSQLYQCQFQCSAGCQTCISDKDCLSCENGYTLEGTTCIQCKTGCASCTSYDNCTQCSDGFYNSGSDGNNPKCVACSRGCKDHCNQVSGFCQCKSDSFIGDRCDRCIDGRYGVICNYYCQTGCASCTRTSGSDCTSCIKGYRLEGTKCIRCKTGCASCKSYDNCTQCLDGFYNSGGEGNNFNCVACSRGCKEHCNQVSGVCRCRSDFFTGDRCDRCVDRRYGVYCNYHCQSGCATCTRTSGFNCTSCIQGYTLEGTTCRRCKTGCASCTAYDNCTQCLDGYYNSGGEGNNLNCVACSRGCKNCNQVSGFCRCVSDSFTGDRCDICSGRRYGVYCNYYCQSGCATCTRTSGSECTSCIQGYRLEGTACIRCKTGCASCTSYENCSKCSNRYYNSGNDGNNLNCVACSRGCKDNCNPVSGFCRCVSDSFIGDRCDICSGRRYGVYCNYYCQSGCSTCSRTSGSECTSCFKGYRQEGTTCIRCKTGCASCTSYDNCTQCSIGYYNSGSAGNNLNCVACSLGCKGYCNQVSGFCPCRSDHFTGDRCDRCSDGRYGVYCNYVCQPGCATCSRTSGSECTSCLQRYRLEGTTCIRCKTGCASCTSYDNCTQCSNGYYNSGGEGKNLNCVACSLGCKGYCNQVSGFCPCRSDHFTGDRCDRCSDGRFGVICNYVCQTGCATCTRTSGSECASCLQRYRLDGTNCIRCKTGCASCTSYDNCTQCVDGYYNSGGEGNNLNCVACSWGCKENCNQVSGFCQCRSDHFTGDRCDICIDGRYGVICNYYCQTGCATCTRTSGSDCTSCIKGYRLEGTTCIRCKTGCASCTSYDNCTQCLDGYYNSGGEGNNLNCIACSRGCKDHCNQVSGFCSCKSDSFTGDRCDICSDGSYGAICNSHCQTGCATCTRTSGSDCTSCNQGYTLEGTKCIPCETGCASCTSYDTCTKCVDGYYNSGGEGNNLKCVACSRGCKDHCNQVSGYCRCNSDSFTGARCDKCTDGRYGEMCNYHCHTGCAICTRTSGSDCTSCIQGYRLEGTTCINCKTECPSCSAYDNCTQCVDGYFNSASEGNNLTCVPCSSGCKEHCNQVSGSCRCRLDSFTGDRCDICVDGRYGEMCNYHCQTGCATCTRTSGSDCTSCIQGYRLEGSTCKRCKTGCAYCTSYDNCTQCLDGYYNSGGEGNNLNCIACSQGCKERCNQVSGFCRCRSDYFTGDRCDRCVDGRYWVSCNYRCQTGCATCTRTSGSNCTSCIRGYTLEGTKCILCKTGCASCTSYDNCTKCVDGYFNSAREGNNLNCVACSQGCKDHCNQVSGLCHCISDFFTGGRCERCFDGRYGEMCNYHCRTGCSSCTRTSGSDCTSCIQGYKLEGSTCIQCKTGCASCTSYDNCSQCLDGYYNSGDNGNNMNCVACSSGCKSHCNQVSGFCRCISDSFTGARCDRCIDGRYGETCGYRCQTGCAACTRTSWFECTSCIQGYRLEGTTCIRCKTGCASCTSYEKCTECVDGYYNSGNDSSITKSNVNCVNCSVGCKDHCNQLSGFCRCSSDSFDGDRCDRCIDGRYGEICNYNCQTGCASCSRTSGSECTSCKMGYILEGITCRRCKTGCASCTSYDNCTQCLDGYFNSGGDGYHLNCVACSLGCKDHCKKSSGFCWCTSDSFAGAKCDRCSDGRYGEICNYPCLTGCTTCTRTSGSECTSCMQGYRLEGTICTQCKTGCASCTSYDNCTQCSNGYYNSGGAGNNLNCVACSLGCKGNCIKSSGFCRCTSDSFAGAKCDRCSDGRYGEICNYYCLTGCASCTRTSGSECTSCIQGYRLEGTTCIRCKTGCASCTSYDNCTQCLDGYFNSGGDGYHLNCVACSLGCKGHCIKSSGFCRCTSDSFAGAKCDRCSAGRYGEICNYHCLTGCTTCTRTSGSECTSCMQGYTLEGTMCIQCKTGCASCTSYDNCIQCSNGYYNSGGEGNNLNCVACSRGCTDHCNRVSGFCRCVSDTFTGDRCDRCVDGRYGEICNYRCQKGCVTCTRTSGSNCTSCIRGHTLEGTTCIRCKTGCASCASYDKCAQCVDGYFSSGNDRDNVNCVACSRGCKDHCNQVSGFCRCRSDSFTGDRCDRCIDGMYGENCNYLCKTGCVACSRTSGSECTSCIQGYTLEGTRCRRCKTGCASCTSYENCTQCVDGYYNSGDGSNNSNCVACSRGCSNQCDNVSGSCTCVSDAYSGDRCDRCIDGRYGIDCTIPCQSDCATCTRISGSDCTSCLNGYYLQGNTCQQCKPGCDECSSFAECILCMDGYYTSGTDCIACSSGCSTQCNKSTGNCICKHEFDGERCDRCVTYFNGTNCDQCSSGYFGTSCNQTCPDNCKRNKCDRNYGRCTKGCTENFVGTTCNDCSVGLYAHDCSLQCPNNCDGSCNRSSGYCQQCKANFVGNTCDQCIAGKHGPSCTLACSSVCKDNYCDRDTGTCDNCQDGVYGDQCGTPCSPHCSRKSCDQKTGVCTYGCKQGYSGDMCCLKGLNCKYCSSPSRCLECLPGKYDKACNSECPSKCSDNICNKNNGTCNNCTDGFQGHYCTVAISATESPDGTPWAAIGWGLAGGILIIIVVLLIVYRRRRDGMSDVPQGSNTEAGGDSDNPIYTYIDEMRVASNEAQGSWKAVQDKTRELQKYHKKQQKLQKQEQKHQQHILKYQQKEAKYAEEAARIEYELNEMKGQPIHHAIEDAPPSPELSAPSSTL